MRVAIHSLLVDLSKAYKPCKIMGIYPPRLNLSKDQTEEQMFNELKKMIDFMRNPQYSYLTKNRSEY